MDTSLLLEYLPAYAFPLDEKQITTNLVLGVSLGGHAAWHCVMNDSRISAAVIVVGCPDYMALMGDRARRTKLKTWTSSEPAGSEFWGSSDFPTSLVRAVQLYDPASLLISELDVKDEDRLGDPSTAEKERLRPIMESRLAGRKILTLSGGADQLVPYSCGEPFLKFLKNAIAPGSWFSGQGTYLEDVVFDGIAHEFTSTMKGRAISFISDFLAGDIAPATSSKTSKI
jgi:pimeloyl-ACP methyl ester carboxylesterase